MKTTPFVNLSLSTGLFGALFFFIFLWPLVLTGAQSNWPNYVGSSSCRDCHERFYSLWSTSHHGLAMQPFTPAFAQNELSKQVSPLTIGDSQYQVLLGDPNSFIRQSDSHGSRDYPIIHAMGGKNFYFFLTPMERGRLQVLPLAFDVHEKKWYDTTASMVRHFVDRSDHAIDWRDPALTFNTSCFSCHVSQLATNYQAQTDSYHTTWAEPGINCETCHGAAEEHIQICQALKPGESLKETKLITVTQSRGFTAHQVDSACSTCHAKMSAITDSFKPGEDYFNHFDLITLEDIDYYPDGRDLGENYTYTLWRMNPCAKSGQLDCMHCHTSSGRYRFAGDTTNNACLPCHAGRVNNPQPHTHHEPGKESPHCVDCHMPATIFAKMKRSDHSFRPPMPTATIRFQSPNACNLCHKDQDPQWADKNVRQWHRKDFQHDHLELSALLLDARNGKWNRLPEILAYLTQDNHDEIYSSSFIRLMRNVPGLSNASLKVLTQCLQKDSSPLVRSAAAEILGLNLNTDIATVLANACSDPIRLVRVRAATALANLPKNTLPASHLDSVRKAIDEYLATMYLRQDDWTSHYNLGNYHLDGGRIEQAVTAFEHAIKCRPDILPPLINASIAYNRLGRNDRAESVLQQAIKLEPANPAAHLNLALLLGEMGQTDQARTSFRNTLKYDPNSAVAAYNLAVLSAESSLDEALKWSKKACELQPRNDKYAYTYAWYLVEIRDNNRAIEILRPLIKRQTDYAPAYFMLGHLYEQDKQFGQAIEVYRQAESNPKLNDQDRIQFTWRIQMLENR